MFNGIFRLAYRNGRNLTKFSRERRGSMIGRVSSWLLYIKSDLTVKFVLLYSTYLRINGLKCFKAARITTFRGHKLEASPTDVANLFQMLDYLKTLYLYLHLYLNI